MRFSQRRTGSAFAALQRTLRLSVFPNSFFFFSSCRSFCISPSCTSSFFSLGSSLFFFLNSEGVIPCFSRNILLKAEAVENPFSAAVFETEKSLVRSISSALVRR